MVYKKRFVKELDDIIKYLNYLNKPEIKASRLVFLWIQLIILVSILLHIYDYMYNNYKIISNFVNTNEMLSNALLFIAMWVILFIPIKILSSISNRLLYKLPKLTFFIYGILSIFIIYKSFNYIPSIIN